MQQQRIYAWVNEDISRITSAVKAHFDAASPKILATAETLYPNTTQHLFDAALHLIEGKWGQHLKERFSMPSEFISSPSIVLSLLLVDLSHYNGPIPEIFQDSIKDPRWEPLMQHLRTSDDDAIAQAIFGEESPCHALIPQSLPADYLKALMQRFDSFIDNLNNPSSHLVHLFLDYQYRDKAIQAAIALHQPIDQSKGLEALINVLLLENNLEKVIELWKLIPLTSEQHQVSLKLVDQMVAQQLTDQALGFIAAHPKHHERDLLTKEVALALTKHHRLDKALDVVRSMGDDELQAYALSHISRILAYQNKFHRAKEIALSILDEEFKEDAIISIVKGYLFARKVDEAIKFVDTLEEGEKKKPALAIENALKAFHREEKVRALHRIFNTLEKRGTS